MKVSYNWLKQYVQIEKPAEEVADILTAIGLEIEGLERIESIKGGLQGIIVGEVLTCEKHPNADRLSLTTVNIGNDQVSQIVCGAPNVTAGQKVLVAPPGTTLYSKDGEPWKLKKAKVRGETSEGMICAEDELGLGDMHEGIIVLPEDCEVGKPASDYYDVEIDHIFEIGLTPNRSDATCHLGVADDLRAFLKINEGFEGEVNWPDTSSFAVDNHDHEFEVIVQNDIACPRYTGVSISNIKIGPSPKWLQNRLTAVDVRPINNVVDITNFVLHEMGQPLHAFDAAKIADKKIIVSTLPDETPFVSLDEVERKLSIQDLMICDGNRKPMCIGGVFGGLGTGVSESTQTIFLEAAHFDAGWIRRSSTRHLLRTDAAKVFEKGSDPNIALEALKRAALLIREITGATIASDIVDLYPKVLLPKVVHVDLNNVNRLIGIEIPKETIENILGAMNMNIVSDEGNTIHVAIPTNKSDVTREADVIEEILRIYGYDNVPLPSKMSTVVSITDRPSFRDLQESLARFLSGNGFLQMMGMSLTNSAYYEKGWIPKTSEHVDVMNTSNMHLDIMRPEMLVSALEAVSYNQNRQQSNLRLFELGRSYIKSGDDFDETEHLVLIMTGTVNKESWHGPSKSTSYFDLKMEVERLLNKIGLGHNRFTRIEENPLFDYGLSVDKGPMNLVEFGKVASVISASFDIKQDVFFADFKLKNLYQIARSGKLRMKELSKYPAVTRDLSMVMDKSVQFQDLMLAARKAEKKRLVSVDLFDIYENAEQLGENKKSYALRLIFEDNEKTMNEKEIDQMISKIIKNCEKEVGAVLR